jgi:hypothetical protein
MRYHSALAFLTLLLVPASASAQVAPHDSSCPLPTPALPVNYSRLHQIPTTASNDDVSHTIVTPGGMLLHSPNMIAARDVLAVIARDPDAMCFHLLTLGKERHTCELGGIARKESQGSYLFSDAGVAIRFTFIAEDQVNVAPIGTTYRSACEPLGSVEQAIYTLNVQSR